MNKKLFLFFAVFLTIFLLNYVSAWNNSFTSGLIHSWGGDCSGSNLKDIRGAELGLQFDGILEGNAVCLSDGSVLLNGIDAYVNISGYSGSPDGTEDFTITFLINQTGKSSASDESNNLQGIFQNNVSLSTEGSWGAVSNGVTGYDFYTGNFYAETTTDFPKPDSQNHLAIFTGNSTHITLYVNGTYEGTATRQAIKSGDLIFGWIGSYSNWFFNGTYEQVNIWNRAFTPSEVNDYWNNSNVMYYIKNNITLISPADATVSNNPNQTFIINWIGLDNLTFFLWDAIGAEVLTPSILDLTGDYSNSSTFYFNFSFPYADDGIYYWNSLGNDTIWANNGNFTFTLDTIFPLIDITYPINNTNFTDGRIDVNYTVSDIYLSNCWYSNDSYLVNTTLDSCSNITQHLIILD